VRSRGGNPGRGLGLFEPRYPTVLTLSAEVQHREGGNLTGGWVGRWVGR